jgi:hypothetical protein
VWTRLIALVRTGLGPTRPLTQWLSGLLPGVKRPERDVYHSYPSNAEVKERVEICQYFMDLHGQLYLCFVFNCTYTTFRVSNRRKFPRISLLFSVSEFFLSKYIDLPMNIIGGGEGDRSLPNTDTGEFMSPLPCCSSVTRHGRREHIDAFIFSFIRSL